MSQQSIANVDLVSLDQIEEIWFNPNVVEKEELDALKEDMKKGQEAISPIIIVEKFPVDQFPGAKDQKKRYVCADGNHRLRIARELKWKDIPAIIDTTVHSEADLRSANYRKNKERGQTDAFKEADLFAWFVEQGKTQQQIADEFNVDRTYVTKRLSLKKLSKATLGITESVKGMEASHYEVIAPLPEQLQEKAAREIVQDSRQMGGVVRVSQVIDIVKQVKREQEVAEKFQKAMEKDDAKFKECPNCKGQVAKLSWNGYPMVQCDSYHVWDVTTGKSEHGGSSSSSSKPAGKKKPELARFIRTEHPIQEFQSAILRAVQDANTRIKELDGFSMSGKATDGGDVIVTLNEYSDGIHFGFECGRLKKFDLHVEKKEYKQENLKNVRSIVHLDPYGTPSKKKHEDLEQHVKEFFSKYGESKPSDEKVDIEKAWMPEDREALQKLEARLISGQNASQLAALRKLKEMAKV